MANESNVSRFRAAYPRLATTLTTLALEGQFQTAMNILFHAGFWLAAEKFQGRVEAVQFRTPLGDVVFLLTSEGIATLED